jgi:medium-chain acyl-[acyl-carrier-protein] hydrolase
MGGLISFELARHLRRHGRPQPIHLFPSGRYAPQTIDTGPHKHTLSDQALLEQIRLLNGTPAEILNDREFMQFLLPTFRADFALCETYRYYAEAPLDCPITAFGGDADEAHVRAGIPGWELQSGRAFALRMFPGDHFFIRSCESSLLEAITADIQRYLW